MDFHWLTPVATSRRNRHRGPRRPPTPKKRNTPMPIKITLEDGTTRELPDGFPTTQAELDAIRDRALAPKLQRISELEATVQTLTSEKEAIQFTRDERDKEFDELAAKYAEAERTLLVQQGADAKGVPAKWLRGDDKAALEASADEWLADARGVVPGAGSGDGAGGYVGSAGTGDESPARPSFEEAKQRAYERAKNQRKGALA